MNREKCFVLKGPPSQRMRKRTVAPRKAYVLRYPSCRVTMIWLIRLESLTMQATSKRVRYQTKIRKAAYVNCQSFSRHRSIKRGPPSLAFDIAAYARDIRALPQVGSHFQCIEPMSSAKRSVTVLSDGSNGRVRNV